MGERDIQRELNRALGPEYISYKAGTTPQEIYIEGWVAMHLANEIFGYDGWSSEIKQTRIEDIEEREDKRYTVSASAHIRVTLTHTEGNKSVYREDIGFGIAENMKGKGKAIKNAQKSAVTDAIKRTLRQFGTALGGCCNDKEYGRAIRRVKPITRQGINETELMRPNSIRTAERKKEEKVETKKERERVQNAPSTVHKQEVLRNIEDIDSAEM